MSQTLVGVSGSMATTDALAAAFAKAVQAQLAATENMSLRALKALATQGLCVELAFVSGTDYSADHKSLIRDAQRAMAGIPLTKQRFERVMQMSFWNNMQTQEPDVNTLVSLSRDFALLSEPELDRIQTFLRYQIAY